jgi:hypothetical protein
MQKVEGSSPFIRFRKPAGNGGFFCVLSRYLVQDHGIEAGMSRTIEAEQHPEGVTPGSPLSDCEPSFFLVESG